MGPTDGPALTEPAEVPEVPELAERWRTSGVAALTGRADGPALLAPAGVVGRIVELGEAAGVDALTLMTERAAIAGLSRQGDRSCGGASRLLPTADGWIAVTLAREDDIDLVPAWLEIHEAPGADPWGAVSRAAADRPGAELVERARLLGLPVAMVGSVVPPAPTGNEADHAGFRSPSSHGPPPRTASGVDPLGRAPLVSRAAGSGDAASQPAEAGSRLSGLPVRTTRFADGPAPRRPTDEAPLVVDLSSLWAGPLCARILGDAGAHVVKVESVHRPDGARRGPPELFDLLHGGHRAVALDFRTVGGRAALARLVDAADVVIEASRPRALAQLGLAAEDVLRRGGGSGPAVWVSITGYGRRAPGRDWVAFGDDAAAAGGLVAWDAIGPCFVADAVADPLSGIAAAAATMAALGTGGTWLVDVAMAEVAAHVASGAPASPTPASWLPLPPFFDQERRRSRDVPGHRTGRSERPARAPGRAAPDHPNRGQGGPARVSAAVMAGAGGLLFRGVEVDGLVVDVRVADGVVAELGERLRPSVHTSDELVIDGGGGALLPGLHDHHIHLLALAAALGSVRVGPPEVTGHDQLAAALRQADATLPPGAWIRAVGYHEQVAGPLDRHLLDAMVPNRPVRVQHRSGALWVLNTAGLRAAGLDGATDPPSGVEHGADGEPTGRLFRLDAWLADRVPSAAPDLAAVGRLLARRGVTGVTDATPVEHPAGLDPIAHAVETGDLPQHVVVTGGPALDPAVAPGLPRGPVKLLLHDHDLPSLDTLAGWVATAHRAGRPVAVHCVTREALVLTLVALEDAGPADGDRIEHGAVVPVELIPRLQQLGLTVVTQPSFVAERGDQYRTEVDPADRADLWRCRSLRDGGVGLAAGTDAPFGDPDPWRAIAAAVERRTPSGHVLGPGERLSPHQALDLFLAPLDRPAGPPRRVAPGSPADLCLLAAPLAATLADPAATEVVATVIAGTVAAGGLH